MFSSIRKAKILIPFFYERLGDYAELARMDLVQFRRETIHSIAGAVVGAAALLLLVSFIGIAAIVTGMGHTASHPHRMAGGAGLGPLHRRLRVPGATVDRRHPAVCAYRVRDIERLGGG